MQVVYNAPPTLARFHNSDAFVRGIMGPIGSGKSTGCAWEIFRRGQEQKLCKAAEGEKPIRKSRWAVVRNTYRELEDTTVKTWLDWFPEDQVGKFYWNSMTHKIRYQDVEIEVLFRALDKPKDVKKLLSLELTGAWVNEAREIPKGVIDMLQGRVGRYPSMREGGPTWHGVIMDTNPPDDDHWWYKFFEEVRPEGWALFKQPPGTSEHAENVENLVPGYYRRISAGKSTEWVKVYVLGEYGFVVDGKPVYPEFADNVHVPTEDIPVIPGATLYIGIDFGLTPAAVFAQKDVMGRWRWIDELVTEDMGAKRFGELLRTKLNADYPNMETEIWGDPAGDDRAQTDETTPFEILESEGIEAHPAPSNDPVLRREAVATPLNRLVDGVPGLLISPKCKITRRGMAGGYKYRRMQIAGDERFQDKPDKNRFSHPCEAGQYVMLGGGEGDVVLGHTPKPSNQDDLPQVSNWMS